MTYLYESTFVFLPFFALLVLVIAMSLGRIMKSYVDDYQPIASLFEAENSTGFNAIYRILIAPVLITAISIILYIIKLDYLVSMIWLVSVYYFILQFILLVSLRRWGLANKTKFLFFHILSISISYYLYVAVISKGLIYILPDESNLRTDVWLIIIVFIYGIFKNIPENNSKFKHRKTKYITNKARGFRRKYRFILDNYDEEMTNILIAIMIYEDYNRPRLIRFIENISLAKTKYVMQVEGARNDKESIIITERRIRQSYDSYINLSKSKDIDEWQKRQLLDSIFSSHNPNDYDYAYRVNEIYQQISENRPQ